MRLYIVASRLPDSERYNLSAQIRRAAVSLTANIAEGYGRFHFKENIQFCRIARGSAYELIDHLVTCPDEHYLAIEEVEALHRELLTFVRLLNGYIRSIGASKRTDDSQ
jgi:four helix bundle protein